MTFYSSEYVKRPSKSTIAKLEDPNKATLYIMSTISGFTAEAREAFLWSHHHFTQGKRPLLAIDSVRLYADTYIRCLESAGSFKTLAQSQNCSPSEYITHLEEELRAQWELNNTITDGESQRNILNSSPPSAEKMTWEELIDETRENANGQALSQIIKEIDKLFTAYRTTSLSKTQENWPFYCIDGKNQKAKVISMMAHFNQGVVDFFFNTLPSIYEKLLNGKLQPAFQEAYSDLLTKIINNIFKCPDSALRNTIIKLEALEKNQSNRYTIDNLEKATATFETNLLASNSQTSRMKKAYNKLLKAVPPTLRHSLLNDLIIAELEKHPLGKALTKFYQTEQVVMTALYWGGIKLDSGKVMTFDVQAYPGSQIKSLDLLSKHVIPMHRYLAKLLTANSGRSSIDRCKQKFELPLKPPSDIKVSTTNSPAFEQIAIDVTWWFIKITNDQVHALACQDNSRNNSHENGLDYEATNDTKDKSDQRIQEGSPEVEAELNYDTASGTIDEHIHSMEESSALMQLIPSENPKHHLQNALNFIRLFMLPKQQTSTSINANSDILFAEVLQSILNQAKELAYSKNSNDLQLAAWICDKICLLVNSYTTATKKQQEHQKLNFAQTIQYTLNSFYQLLTEDKINAKIYFVCTYLFIRLASQMYQIPPCQFSENDSNLLDQIYGILTTMKSSSDPEQQNVWVESATICAKMRREVTQQEYSAQKGSPRSRQNPGQRYGVSLFAATDAPPRKPGCYDHLPCSQHFTTASLPQHSTSHVPLTTTPVYGT